MPTSALRCLGVAVDLAPDRHRSREVTPGGLDLTRPGSTTARRVERSLPISPSGSNRGSNAPETWVKTQRTPDHLYPP